MRETASLQERVLPSAAARAVWSLAAVLLLTAVSPSLQAQGEARTAPEDEQAFHRLVVGQRLIESDALDHLFSYVEFVAAGRFKLIQDAETKTGSYSYSNTGVNTGDLVLNYDDGDSSTLHLVFISATAGTIEALNWRLIPIPESDPLTTLYFPDYVDGGGWSVQLALSHITSTTEDAAVLVTAYDRGGQEIRDFFALKVIPEDREITNEHVFMIPPLGTRVLKSAGPHNNPERELRRGWIKIQTDTASVRGLLTYRQAETALEVSVEPVELGRHYALFVEQYRDIGTGLAIFKPDPTSTIEFRIRDENGTNPLGEGFSTTHPIGGKTFQQAALPIRRWYALDGIDTEFLRDFRGLLFLRSEEGALFAPIGLRFRTGGGSLSAVPVFQITDEDVPSPPL